MAERRGDSGLLRAAKWNFDLPPDAARRFVEDMRAYHAEKSTYKREEIAAKQAELLNEHLSHGARRMKTPEVAEVFTLMMAQKD